MNSVELRKIDESNYLDCFNLKLGEGQERFVSHPIRSLAQAYVYYNQCTPFGIYAGDKMVGYVMVIYDYDEETYNIWHMMIDRSEQGRGYGKAALKKVLEYIGKKPFGGSGHILLTCNPENRTAYSMYKKLGFTESGRGDEDETELEYYLD
ncbi:MAG: GNAT family N-acetyltransferase [Oscillospiraceae bacterium]